MQLSPVFSLFTQSDVCALLQSALDDKSYKHTPVDIISTEVIDLERRLYRVDLVTKEHATLVAILHITKSSLLSVYAIHHVVTSAKKVTLAPNFSAGKGLNPLLFMGLSTHYNLKNS